MESDLSLIKKIQSEDNQACLESLIQRHSGIYVYVVDQYTKNPNSIIDRETIMQEKDTVIYTAALNYNPKCKSKFSTYLANEAKWKCLNAISKVKRRKETSLDEITSGISENSSLTVNDNSCERLIKLESFNVFKDMLDSEKDKRVKKIIDIRYNTTNNKLVPWRIVAKEIGMSIQGCINIHNKFINKVKKQLTKKNE